MEKPAPFTTVMMTPPEVCEWLGIGRSTYYRCAKEGGSFFAKHKMQRVKGRLCVRVDSKSSRWIQDMARGVVAKRREVPIRIPRPRPIPISISIPRERPIPRPILWFETITPREAVAGWDIRSGMFCRWIEMLARRKGVPISIPRERPIPRPISILRLRPITWDEALLPREAIAELGISRSTFYRWIEEEKISVLHQLGSWEYPVLRVHPDEVSRVRREYLSGRALKV